MSVDPWQEMTRDPRVPQHAPIRASDADREVVLRVLGDAYGDGRLDRDEFDERSAVLTHARTLGELSPLLSDLVPEDPPSRGSLAGVAPLDLDQVEAQAVAAWERSRREAFVAFTVTSLICWVVWAATMPGDFPWPLFPMLGTFIPVLVTQMTKNDAIASSRKKLIARHDKQVAKAERQLDRDRSRRGELGDGRPDA